MYRVYVDAFSLPEAARMRQLLASTGEFELVGVDVGASDDVRLRRRLLNESDFVVVGGPSAGEDDPLEWIESRRVRIVRACSTRADDSWTYGLPELSSTQRRQIAEAGRVVNPGCCAAGAILLLRPLVVSGLLAQTAPVNVFCVAGSTARGAWQSPPADTDVCGFGHVLDHPYATEIRRHALLESTPNFIAVRGGFERGAMLYVPLHAGHMNPALPRRVPRALVEQALMKYYEGSEVVTVAPGIDELPESLAELHALALRPDLRVDTNGISLHVYGSRDGERLCLAAVYDNMGKGHCGAVLQNLRIMAGLA